MKTILAFIIIIMSTTVQAQEVKNFTLTNIKDGKEVSLNNFNSAKAVAIVFTSHDMDAIRAICQSCLFLDKGRMMLQGDVDECVRAYQEICAIDRDGKTA